MAFDAPRAMRWAVLLCCALPFIGASMLQAVDGVHVSPDETANAYFARLFARTGSLAAYDPLSAELGDALYPRSAVSHGGYLAPGGFIGIPALYGTVIRALGEATIPWITPALALAAVLAWGAAAARIFGARVGAVSAFALAVHPAWAYWASRSLMPNAPFASLLVLSAFAAICRPLSSRASGLKGFPADLLASGALFGLALSVRPSELLWLVPAALAAWVALGRTKPRLAPSLAFFAGVSLVAAPMLFLNAQTYGQALTSGYASTASVVASAQAPVAVSAWERFQDMARPLFPFGLHPRNALRAVRDHGLGLFWWLAPLALIGLIRALRERGAAPEARAPRRAYHAFFLVSAAYLAALYGSWAIHDNPDPDAVSIANSYARYWLPAFVLSTPYLAMAALWATDRAASARGKRLIGAGLALAAVALCVRATFFARHDGIVTVSETLQADAHAKAVLLSLTEPEAVIVTDRADKLLFPERRVRVPLRDEATYALLPRLVNRAPAYYYGITLPEADLRYLNGEKLVGTGLMFVPVETIGISTLYRIERGIGGRELGTGEQEGI